MKLRAKIILTAASLALSCALLAGCGSSSFRGALSVLYRLRFFQCEGYHQRVQLG